MSHNAPCSCKPGEYEEGWQEKRCRACLDAEMRGWSEFMARVPGIVAALRKDSDHA